ncbi:glycosyltransferase family 4 protein [Pseudoalteromonas distincta]|uniref:glycosyltransferase family 4 protein n=1 Tax=Pseudoalteromonas distincta TaxID=77608 RepID=UPI00186A2B5A|nr:glycosyltransferase family 4 protein [Pseudoalteromonas distincta]MBE3672546.1 colanic acid/amylovoran biosynthesis glycosyltransferase [Pseudoalteromonas distincta KMM 3548]MDC3212136.1 glycosyltransferase family 4 protein [Pseudoalteromonas distincta]
MKVLHYIPNFSVTTETFIYDQVIGIQNEGVESVVLTSNRLNLESRPFSNVCVLPFNNIWNDRITHSLSLRFQLMPFLIQYKKWKRILDEFKPDIIHCHTGNAVKTWMHVSEKLGITIPTVASMHGSDVNSEPLVRSKYKDVLTRAGRQRFIHWTVPSEFLKKKIALNLLVPKNKVSVIYNSINPIFTSFYEKITFDQLKIISVGRFITCKGQVFLIRSLVEVIKVYPDARLTLVGSGPLKQSLVKLSQELGVHRHINFINSVSHGDLPSLLSKHNIYVQPSIEDEVTHQEEAFGVAALEAMAIGLPVIVTECGGLKELANFCDEKSVSVVSQSSETEITQAIIKHFLQQYPISLENRAEISNVFSHERNINAVIDIYKEIMNA